MLELPAEALQTLYYAPVEVRRQVRMLVRNEEPWWVAADVCALLGLTNPTKACSALDPDEVMTLTTAEAPVTLTNGAGHSDGMTLTSSAGHSGPGGARMWNLVNESGLYSLILRSRKPEAKAFKRWVTHEVLPTLRRTGAYTGGFGPGQGDRSGAGSICDREPHATAQGGFLPPGLSMDTLSTTPKPTWQFLARVQGMGWFRAEDLPDMPVRTFHWHLYRLAAVGILFDRRGRAPTSYRLARVEGRREVNHA